MKNGNLPLHRIGEIITFGVLMSVLEQQQKIGKNWPSKRLCRIMKKQPIF